MRRTAFLVFVGLFLIFVLGQSVRAYEIDTHEGLSKASARNSVLANDRDMLRAHGLSFSIEDDRQQFPNSQGEPKNLLQLIADGSRFEDGLKSDCETRPKHHFYDPARHRGLNKGLLIQGERSPDWALEDESEFLGGTLSSRQNYSLRDARDYLYWALTATREEDRNKFFGLTFQTLGHVAHHVQDMAQPQHTRNDIHLIAGEDCSAPTKAFISLFQNPSRYEQYTKALGASLPLGPYPKKVRFDTARQYWHTEKQNPAAGQGLAEFSNTNFVSAGTNFSFNEDDTVATNARYALPAPDGRTTSLPIETLLKEKGESAPCWTNSAGQQECLSGGVVFHSTRVTDRYLGTTQDNPRATSLSVFDQDLRRYNKGVLNVNDPEDPNDDTVEYRAFTLNRFNFDYAHGFLLTRAVAYSAGLIDYFFRGRLEIQDAGYTDAGVSLRIRNAIDPDAEPVWKNETLASGGELRVAFDYKTPDGKSVYGVSNAVTLTEDIKPGLASAGHYSFTFPDNAIPEDAKEIRYRLVFRGRIGKEDGAVAVGAFKPMSGFVVVPNYAPADGITKKDETRLIYRSHGKWKLSPEKGIQAGNVDWRGWYVNGNPTKLLTWVGARARYMPDREVCMYHPAGCRWASSSVTGREVYQDGELFARAPADVLGAAVTRDSHGKDWLVVITLDGPNLGEVVWRRPYEKNDSDALYDPTSNPKGWQEIGRFKGSDYSSDANRINHHADIPWFFSGNGTRAQTMRRWWDTSNNRLQQRLDRLEISIVDDVTRATFTNHKNLDGIVSYSTCSSSYDADGAGSGSRNSSGNGELVVAVDFKDNEPLLAKVKVESSGSTTSTVTVTKDSNGRVTSTSGRRDATGNQKDTLFWGDGTSLTIVDGAYKFKSEWFSGSGTSTYSHADESSTREMEIGYYFDLRYKLFSYYVYGNSDKTNLSIVDGARTNTGSGTFAESHRIDSAIAGSQVPYTFESSYALSPNEPATYALYCSNSDTRPATTTYGYNFPWFFETTSAHNVGLWAVDLNKRVLVSQYMVSDFGYADAGSYNALISNDTPPVQPLSVIIPGGNDKSVYFSPYFPIGVVR